MNFSLLLNTVVHLKLQQVVFQVYYRLHKPIYKQLVSPNETLKTRLVDFIPKPQCLKEDVFSFLNLSATNPDWSSTGNGMLWAYNLNYMDWLGQEGLTTKEGEKWIDRFIVGLDTNQVGIEPYPIALRSINWIKFFIKNPEIAKKEKLDSLYSQVKLLENKLEYHLLGNHLLEDAYALFIAAVFFQDKRLYSHACQLLNNQLEEQILPDGAHYEQSPMYHCILLDRLLDCLNFSLATDDAVYSEYLKEKAVRMLGHLESVVWDDKTIPLLNDSAYGIAPLPKELFDYAKRLGLSWCAITMNQSGYRKLKGIRVEAIVDVGNITAKYQPGHTHADTFNYELRIDGKPFIVDTGISTYNKTARRQYERGSSAHNTVVVEGKNSSQVWGGFRVGSRCHVRLVEATNNNICAFHDGYGKPCKRIFSLEEDKFIVEDYYKGDAVSIIHFVKDADTSRISIEGARSVEFADEKYSTEYNKFLDCKVMKIHFSGKLRYSIQ